MLNDDVILTFRSDCILWTNVGDYVSGWSNKFNDDSRGITMPVVLAVYHFYYSHLQLFQDKGRGKNANRNERQRQQINYSEIYQLHNPPPFLWEQRTKETLFKCAAVVKTELTAESSGAVAYGKILFHRFWMARLLPNQSLRRPGDFQRSVVLSFLILNWPLLFLRSFLLFFSQYFSRLFFRVSSRFRLFFSSFLR